MDILVVALILLLGVLEFVHPLNGDVFFKGDTVYVEFARSILERGRYGLDFNDAQYPPGLPALLAPLCAMTGCGHGTLVRSMAIILALALVASYRLLTREAGRAVAAMTCLLIASSPIVFTFTTRTLSSDLPYFFCSVATLLLAAKVDKSECLRKRILLGLLCMVMLGLSLLFRNSGVALIAGLIGWLAIGSWLTDQATRARRWRTFSGILLAGVVLQGAWMVWVAKHETVEWPTIQGYPRNYLSQLIVKSGIQPELGTAAPVDFVSRVPINVADRAVGLMEIVTRKAYFDSNWYSPAVLGTVLLIALGLGASLRSTGGSLSEWYFIAHEAMYSIWPWPYEMRFLLPVAPLACLYLWRGGSALRPLAARAPRAVGAAGALIGLLAGSTAAVAGWNSAAIQPRLAALFWTLIVVASIWLMSPYKATLHDLSMRIVTFRRMPLSSTGKSNTSLTRSAGAMVAIGFVVFGFALQLDIGRENLSFDVTKHSWYPRIVAARWIAEHAPGNAVVMARQMDVIHHNAHRKVVWFPPISDSQTLMDGIRRLGVDFILVTNVWTYYLPLEDDCIDPLLKAYPQAFRVVHEGTGFRIVEVVRERLPFGAM